MSELPLLLAALGGLALAYVLVGAKAAPTPSAGTTLSSVTTIPVTTLPAATVSATALHSTPFVHPGAGASGSRRSIGCIGDAACTPSVEYGYVGAPVHAESRTPPVQTEAFRAPPAPTESRATPAPTEAFRAPPAPTEAFRAPPAPTEAFRAPPAPTESRAPPPALWAPKLSEGERSTGLGVRFVYEAGKGVSPASREAGPKFPGVLRFIMPESSAIYHGSYVLSLEFDVDALARITESMREARDDVPLLKVSEIDNNGDPEIRLRSGEGGFRVVEDTMTKEIDAPAYYTGTRLLYVNDRARARSEMFVRSGNSTLTINMRPSWPGSSRLSDNAIELQFHECVRRAVFLWGPEDVSPDIARLRQESAL